MTHRLHKWLRSFWLVALCLFLTQSALCLAEHAGWVALSCDSAGLVSDCGDSTHEPDSHNAHCCHLETQAAPHPVSFVTFSTEILSGQLSLADEAALEGPVQEIDHPPQLS